MYIHVGWGFVHCMCWFHGRMIPTGCGSDWPGLVFLLCFCSFQEENAIWKINCVAKLLPARMREQTPALEHAGKLYHNVLKEF